GPRLRPPEPRNRRLTQFQQLRQPGRARWLGAPGHLLGRQVQHERDLDDLQVVHTLQQLTERVRAEEYLQQLADLLAPFGDRPQPAARGIRTHSPSSYRTIPGTGRSLPTRHHSGI